MDLHHRTSKTLQAQHQTEAKLVATDSDTRTQSSNEQEHATVEQKDAVQKMINNK